MKMEESQGGEEERTILTGMATSKRVLMSIAAHKWNNKGPFRSNAANIIAGLCLKYFKQHRQPPRRDLEAIYHNWRNTGKKDKHLCGLVEDLLRSLSSNYSLKSKEINSAFIVDMSGKYFNKVKTERFAEDLLAATKAGDQERCDELTKNYRHVELGQGSWSNPLDDSEGWDAVFTNRDKSMIEFPGLPAMERFYGADLSRDCFVSFIGPEKRGKTWALLDLAWRAWSQHLKVAFFEVGDMTKPQVYTRMGSWLTCMPRKACSLKYPKKVKLSKGEMTVEHIEKEFEYGYTRKHLEQAKKDFEGIRRNKQTKRSDYFRLAVSPAQTMNMGDIRSSLEKWEAEGGWIPDVVCLDYIDLIAPSRQYKEARDRINSVWIEARALNQELHCLLLTATQANRESYSADWISMDHTSEDKRKTGHVTGFVGINYKPTEKKDGIIRWNWPSRRDDDDGVRMYSAGCLALARPIMMALDGKEKKIRTGDKD